MVTQSQKEVSCLQNCSLDVLFPTAYSLTAAFSPSSLSSPPAPPQICMSHKLVNQRVTSID